MKKASVSVKSLKLRILINLEFLPLRCCITDQIELKDSLTKFIVCFKEQNDNDNTPINPKTADITQ